MKIGRYFTLAEFTQSATARALGIDMTPPPAVVANLRNLVTEVLDPIRELIGQPIRVQSGYRPPLLNQKVGGAKTSQHVLGQAADINAAQLTATELAYRIQLMSLPFDQLILEFESWVHISHGPRHRRQVLHTIRDAKGKTRYLPGLN